MKRTCLLFLVICFAATMAMAATNEVTSVNAVGYITVTVPSNGYALTALNFEPVGTNDLTMGDLVGDQLPVGSVAYIWSIPQKTYLIETRTRSGWGTNVVDRGAGFWLQLPGAVATTAQYTVRFLGEVPDSTVCATTTTYNITGIDAVGYAYPCDILWTNTSLAINGTVGDVIYLWDTAITNYQIYTKTRGGWSTPDGFKITPDVGFWYQTTATQNWEETVPYDLSQ